MGLLQQANMQIYIKLVYDMDRKLFSLLNVNTVRDDINNHTFADKFDNIFITNQA